MRKIAFAAAAVIALAGLTACESKADKTAEKQADALEAQAAATPNEAKETQLNQQADRIEQQAGNADGGATTANTPTSDAAPK
jgi:maltose-binding protein MalE